MQKRSEIGSTITKKNYKEELFKEYGELSQPQQEVLNEGGWKLIDIDYWLNGNPLHK